MPVEKSGQEEFDFEYGENYAKHVEANGRKAGIISLGRGEPKEKVQEWLKVGAKIKGIIGYAVGRTIFWQPLADYKESKINRKEAMEKIAQDYIEFTDLWLKECKADKKMTSSKSLSPSLTRITTSAAADAALDIGKEDPDKVDQTALDLSHSLTKKWKGTHGQKKERLQTGKR